MNEPKRVKFGIGERVRIMYTNQEQPFATICAIIAAPCLIWTDPENLVSHLNGWSKYLNVSPQQLSKEFCYMLHFDEPRSPFSKKEFNEWHDENDPITAYEREEILDNSKTNLVVCTERDLEHASNIIPDAI